MKKNKPTQNLSQPELDMPKEALTLGHMVKYNLYLLSKSILFAALIKTDKFADSDSAAKEANRVIGELDLDTKKRLEQIN